MSRFLGVIAAVLSLSHVATAESAADAMPGDDSAWSEPHTVNARRLRSPPPPPRRTSLTGDRLALLAHAGIGAPAGSIGLDLDVAPVSFFALDLGAGYSPGGWQLAATPRFRVRMNARSYLTLGAGVSIGPYDNGHTIAGVACVFFCIMEGMGDSSGDIATQHFARARWYNLELGWDVYPYERGILRWTLGYGFISNDTAYSCTEDPKQYYGPGHGCDRTDGQGLLFAAFAAGFDL